MGYISKEYFDFFSGLAKNNKKEWFHSHKKDYENFVKEPFKSMVEELIFRIQEFEPDLEVTPQKAIFRINRDIRFSKDKSPYKLHLGANIQHGGRTSPNSTGYYVHIGNDNVYIGGGAYHATKDGIYKIRSAIAKSNNEFNKLINDNKFKTTFGEIKGDRLKRVPKEFKEIFQKQPYVGNKQFYFMKELNSDVALENNFTDRIIEYYKIGHSFIKFLKNALQGAD